MEQHSSVSISSTVRERSHLLTNSEGGWAFAWWAAAARVPLRPVRILSVGASFIQEPESTASGRACGSSADTIARRTRRGSSVCAHLDSHALHQRSPAHVLRREGCAAGGEERGGDGGEAAVCS